MAVLLKDDPEKNCSAGHKVAVTAIGKGTPVYKYGYPIGEATEDIAAGELVHEHNLKTGLAGTGEYIYRPGEALAEEPLWTPGADEAFFWGYQRPDGKTGIRNQLWIVNTVGCCNGTAKILAEKGTAICLKHGLEGPFFFSHVQGCSQLGEDIDTTRRILAGLVHHPNAGAVLVLGLGCENNHIELFRREVGEHHPHRVRWLNTQDCDDEIAAGLAEIERLAAYASTFNREKLPLSELIIGLKCGGSDAFSGITANPLTGHFTDIITASGGSAILTEIPEMFGAEDVILNRAINKDVFNRAAEMINGFKNFFLSHNQPVYENPSPGNRSGGITTLEEKSLGCVLKGGHGLVTDVIAHGAAVKEKGITLMDGPGNDLVSVTALTAAGAQLILFTTGRGTPFGGPTPTVKISSNTNLARKKKHWTDFDAGQLLDDERKTAHSAANNSNKPEEVLKDFYRLIKKIASGELKTKNEEHNFREIAIFKTGVTL